MNGIDRSRIKWKNLKQRLGLKGMSCCGATWRARTEAINIIQELELDHQIHPDERRTLQEVLDDDQTVISPPAYSSTTPLLAVGHPPAPSGMNLAMALSAERNLRIVGPGENDGVHVNVKTLMRLLEETDGVDWKNKKKRRDGNGVGGDWVCCVCMDRNKGAAFIPCGHTFCRTCSRELWVKRGSCPICNRSILEILDIF